MAAWDGSRGQTLQDFGLVGMFTVPEATPCGTIVESDFNDGELGAFEFIDGTFGGVGAYEASEGTARLFTTAAVTALDEGLVLGVSDSEEHPELYADGTIELAFRSATSRPLVQLGARLDDIDASLGYVFSAASAPFNFLMVQRGNGDGTGATLAQFPYEVNANVDYRLRATFVGDLIELTLWEAGDMEPAPQISVIDAAPILDGGATGVYVGRSQGTGLVDISVSDFTITLPNECEDPGIVGDLNGDGVVDGADLGILLNNWGGDGVGDLNGDGVVDGADLGILLNNWG